MKNPLNFNTPDILQSELDAIHKALMLQEIFISKHAEAEAEAEEIPLVNMLEAVLVGTAVSKDLPNNSQNRVPGINFEYKIADGRHIRTKVSWFNGFWFITVHTI
jgi:hypothetical protein